MVKALWKPFAAKRSFVHLTQAILRPLRQFKEYAVEVMTPYLERTSNMSQTLSDWTHDFLVRYCVAHYTTGMPNASYTFREPRLGAECGPRAGVPRIFNQTFL